MWCSCTPSSYDLGSKKITEDQLVEGVAYTITFDDENPNIVYLTSLVDKQFTPIWEHPQGRSQAEEVVLKIPFAGEYDINFGVQTRGGIVYGETAKIKIEEMCADFINDPMWELLSGGAGNSKTWYLDLDKNSKSRYFLGPIYFFTDTYKWDNLHTASGDSYLEAEPWDATQALVPNLDEAGAPAWYWLADYTENSWICNAADFGEMTFNLIDGAHVLVNQDSYGFGTKKGSYMLDVEQRLISFSDALPLHDLDRDKIVKDAVEFRILTLTEDYMQIMVVPEGVCYNYISQAYRDRVDAE